MQRKNNKNLTGYAIYLRRNMTKEERHLWFDFLRTYPIKFLRQKILGNYIVDFYCAKAKLVIELDGSQHYYEDGQAYDKIRSEFLRQYGLKIIRISNKDITGNFQGVCQMIDFEVKQSLSQPD